MTEDVQGRIRQLTRQKRFWKRCTLGAAGTLVLVLVAFTSLSLVLYTSLMTEKERLTQQLQDFRKTATDGLQQGKDLLRSLNLDGRKIEQQVRQFLRREAAVVQPPAPPPPAPPAEKECRQPPAALLPPAPVDKDCRQPPAVPPLPAPVDKDCHQPPPVPPLPVPVDKDCRQPPAAIPLPSPPPEQDLSKTIEQGLRRGRELLRGLNIDKRKVEELGRQLLQGDAPADQPPAPPAAVVPEEKH